MQDQSGARTPLRGRRGSPSDLIGWDTPPAPRSNRNTSQSRQSRSPAVITDSQVNLMDWDPMRLGISDFPVNAVTTRGLMETYPPSSSVRHQSYRNRDNNRDEVVETYAWESNVPPSRGRGTPSAGPSRENRRASRSRDLSRRQRECPAALGAPPVEYVEPPCPGAGATGYNDQDPLDTSPIPYVPSNDDQLDNFGWLDENRNWAPFPVQDEEELQRNQAIFRARRDPEFRGIPQGPDDNLTYYGVGPARQAAIENQSNWPGTKEQWELLKQGKLEWWKDSVPLTFPREERHSRDGTSSQGRRSSRADEANQAGVRTSTGRQRSSASKKRHSTSRSRDRSRRESECPGAVAVAPVQPVEEPRPGAAAGPALSPDNYSYVDEQGVRWDVRYHVDPPGYVPPVPSLYRAPPEVFHEVMRRYDPNYDPGYFATAKRHYFPRDFDLRYWAIPTSMYPNNPETDNEDTELDPLDTSPIPYVPSDDEQLDDFGWLDENPNRVPFPVQTEEEIERSQALFRARRDPACRGIPQGPDNHVTFYGVGPARQAAYDHQGEWPGTFEQFQLNKQGKLEWWKDSVPLTFPREPEPCASGCSEEKKKKKKKKKDKGDKTGKKKRDEDQQDQ